jgi:hypothetical protein
MASTFRDLRVWQEAMELTVQVYKSTAVFPKVENYGLAQQMQRAAVSVRVISRKVKGITRIRSSYTFYFTQEGHFGSYRHRFSCPSS